MPFFDCMPLLVICRPFHTKVYFLLSLSVYRLAEAVLECYGHLPQKCNFLKFCKWQYHSFFIRMFGMTDNFFSGPTMKFNKDIKRAACNTNFNRHTLGKQVRSPRSFHFAAFQLCL